MEMEIQFLDTFSNLLETHRVMASLEEGVVYDLAFLKTVLMYRPQEFAEDGTLQESKSVAWEAARIISSFDLENMDKSMVYALCNQLTYHLGRLWSLTNKARNNHYLKAKQMKPLREDFPGIGQLGFVEHLTGYLEQLLNNNAKDEGAAASIGALRFYISRLQQKLHLLSSHLLKIPEPRKEQVDLKDLIQGITNLAYEVEYVVDSFIARDIAIWYAMFWLRDLLKEAKLKKRFVMLESGDKMAIIKSILPKVPVKFNPNIIPIVSNDGINMKVVDVFKTKQIIVKFSVRTRGRVEGYEERKKDVFYELLVKAEPHSSSISCNVRQDELKILVEELQKLLKNKKYFIILQNVSDIDVFSDIRGVLPNGRNGSTILLTTPSPDLVLQFRYGSQKYVHNKEPVENTSIPRTYKPTTGEDVVGFEKETTDLIDMLRGGPKKLCIISIVGMPGQGKTTLAKKVYGDLSRAGRFDVQAWCYVSQVYKKRELLLNLLDQIHPGLMEIHLLEDEELSGLLWRYLTGQRFFIVLDDLWSIEAWNDICRCFPNDKSESRIIFTTRQKDLAAQPQFGRSVELGPLSEDESLKLLLKRLPEPESCPLEILLAVGSQIASNCKGLPLLVIVTAGLLAKVEKDEDQWKQVAETLSSHILDQEAGVKGIIELSYKHLSDNLKPCFLYFGLFLEDKEVSVKKLIRLWIAEGFIKPVDSKSLEDVANDYLMDLIGRSLVTVAREKSNGGVKSCHMHGLLRHFCLTKAREENFLQLIHQYDEHFPRSKRPIYQLRRLCIYSKVNDLTLLMPGPFVRTLLLFASGDMLHKQSYDISFVSDKFKLLNILDLEDIIIGNSFEAIIRLIHLRYLAMRSNMELIIPSSISNIWKLETFLVKGKVVQVPDSIWDMPNLRHVHINEIASFNLEPHKSGKSSTLGNLQTVSTPCFAHVYDMEKMLRRLPGIQKLKCKLLDSGDTATNHYQFPVSEVLIQLVSLNIMYNGTKPYPCMFTFPSNLKKLTLSNFRMSWKEISQLAKLCNLEVLKLLSNSVKGEKWLMQEEVFQKLKFLKLELLNLQIWDASEDNFPGLKHLQLIKCEQLQQIPLGIGDINTLEMIKVMWCNANVSISARRIQESQLELSNESLRIHIHPRVHDPESSLHDPESSLHACALMV